MQGAKYRVKGIFKGKLCLGSTLPIPLLLGILVECDYVLCCYCVTFYFKIYSQILGFRNIVMMIYMLKQLKW